MTTEYCSTCQANFVSEDKKVHLKSDWHVYNLKRVVASLPPIAEADFIKKQTFFVGTTTAATTGGGINKKRYCSYCKKSFNSLKSCDNHQTSKQHRLNVAGFKGRQEFEKKMVAIKQTKPVSDIDSEDETSSQSYPLPLGACLFCERRFNTLAISPQETADRVLRHMSDSHSFVAPYSKELRDPVGLLSELGRIVGEEYACIACGRQFIGRIKGDVPDSARQRRKMALMAVRAHMHDAEHQYIYVGTEDPVELALAIAEAEEDKGALLVENLPPVARIGGELYHQFYEPKQSNKTLVLPDDVDDDSAFEARLPSGAVLGHRKFYKTVYRQHLKSPRSASEERRRTLALTHTSCCVPLAIAARHQAVIDGGQNQTLLQFDSKTLQGFARISRIDAHRQCVRKETMDKYNLDLGIRGNYVLRGHLRRQY